MVESIVVVFMNLTLVKPRMVSMVFVSFGVDVILENECRIQLENYLAQLYGREMPSPVLLQDLIVGYTIYEEDIQRFKR